MEEFKKGAISEEALDEIAGGLGLSSISLKNALIASGVAIVAASSFTAGALVQDMDGVDVAKTVKSGASKASSKVSSLVHDGVAKLFNGKK